MSAIGRPRARPSGADAHEPISRKDRPRIGNKNDMTNIGLYRLGPCMGFEQITSLASAKTFQSVPAGATRAEVQVEGGQARVRMDGTSPTATVGTLLEDGDYVPFGGDPGRDGVALSNVKFIQASGTLVLNIHYF